MIQFGPLTKLVGAKHHMMLLLQNGNLFNKYITWVPFQPHKTMKWYNFGPPTKLEGAKHHMMHFLQNGNLFNEYDTSVPF